MQKSLLVAALALLAISPARADQFGFNFTPNTDLCAAYGDTCGLSATGTFITDGQTYSPLNFHTYPITGLTGSMNGAAMQFLLEGVRPSLPGPGTRPWRDWLYSYANGSSEPITADPPAVPTPESPLGTFVGLGILIGGLIKAVKR
jgi:hypothetical protein